MFKAHRLLPAALLAVVVAGAAPACAYPAYSQYPSGRNGGYNGDVDRRAYEIGYREGINHGQDDARRGRTYSYANDSAYRSADRGYNRAYGNRDEYRRYFRRGYESGYSEGYRSLRRGGGAYGNTYPTYPVYPNGAGAPRGVYRSPAAENGYRDGIEAGRDDARGRDPYDPRRAKRYREGDRGYNNRDGTRDQYSREYRTAFEQGYREGYGRY